MDLEKKILEKIKKDQILPISPWILRIKRLGWLLLFTLVVLVGSLAVGIVLLMATDARGRPVIRRQ